MGSQWHVVKAAAHSRWHQTCPARLRCTCARLCHLGVKNRSKYSSCSTTHRFRQRSPTWAANRNPIMRSTTTSVWRTPDGGQSRNGLGASYTARGAWIAASEGYNWRVVAGSLNTLRDLPFPFRSHPNLALHADRGKAPDHKTEKAMPRSLDRRVLESRPST